MNPATAGRLLDIVAEVAGPRPGFPTAEPAVDALGVGGLMRRLVPGRLAPRPEAEAMMYRLWGELALEAGEELSGHLARAGIPHALFKGVALLGNAYQPGDISMSDVDVLVESTRADEAVHALTAQGFTLPRPDALSMPGDPESVLRRPVPEGADILAVDVDLHGLLWPARRLLPWRGSPLPDDVWNAVERPGRFPVFRPGHHAALLVHHLVRHDFLHFRSLVDLVSAWDRLLDASEAAVMMELSHTLEVGWTARAVVDALARDLSLPPLPVPSPGRPGRRWARPGVSVAWACALALDGTARDFEAITLGRALRRLVTVDGLGAAGSVLRDALVPPDAYLAWRWPDASRAERRLRHLGRILGRLRKTRAPEAEPQA